MLLIPCPWCGARHEDEFVCGGEAERRRPLRPGAVADAAWADYLYNSANAKGPVREWWWHSKGCGKWFQVVRDTATHEIHPVTEEDPR